MGARQSFPTPGAADAPDVTTLLNRWQRGFPLVSQPYHALGAECGWSGPQVMDALRSGIERGHISRVGAVFGVGAGGAGLLCALRVPPERLDEVAARVSAEPAVNHNYAREHEWNLWFVVTSTDRVQVHACVDRIERATGLAALRLPMRRAYRIDLGFDLFDTHESQCGMRESEPVRTALRPLAARLEDGLPLVSRPFAALGEPLGMDEAAVLRAIGRWCEHGTVRRLGVVLRHHEFGISANAMTVFTVPERDIDAVGQRLAAQPGVTLCYRRDPAPGWPYTLYCMVHGRERAAVQALIDQAAGAAGLSGVPRQVLFSTRRFKQTGSRYFSEAAAPAVAPALSA